MASMDAIDRRILAVLQADGRLPVAELAKRVGLSVSPCWRRLRALEEAGVVRGYTALVAPEAVGVGLNVFVYVALKLHSADAFEAEMARREQVLECYAMSGDEDYLLHVMVADVEALERFVRTDLIHMPGVERVRTSLALKTVKHTTALPLGAVG